MSADKQFFDEVITAVTRLGVTQIQLIAQLKEEGVQYGDTAIKSWLNGIRVPPRSVVPAFSKVLRLAYSSAEAVDRVHPSLSWSKERTSAVDRSPKSSRQQMPGGRFPCVLHHVSLAVRDLKKSTEFYEDLLGVAPSSERPKEFTFPGEWFVLPGGQHLHLVQHPIHGTFRPTKSKRNLLDNVDPKDCHLAFRVLDIFAAKEWLRKNKILFKDDPLELRMHQIYFCDPDGHIIELNAL